MGNVFDGTDSLGARHLVKVWFVEGVLSDEGVDELNFLDQPVRDVPPGGGLAGMPSELEGHRQVVGDHLASPEIPPNASSRGTIQQVKARSMRETTEISSP